ncbi:MAG TPA: hypothetical protein VFB34_10905 [Chloroflexota bacterium]|nr:hypothetical protein [Chloroflexota bacterium]
MVPAVRDAAPSNVDDPRAARLVRALLDSGQATDAMRLRLLRYREDVSSQIASLVNLEGGRAAEEHVGSPVCSLFPRSTQVE